MKPLSALRSEAEIIAECRKYAPDFEFVAGRVVNGETLIVASCSWQGKRYELASSVGKLAADSAVARPVREEVLRQAHVFLFMRVNAN